MSNDNIALMAHLMRRAGFGANRDELERCVEQGYEATVEELLDTSNANNMPDDIIRRYHVEQSELRDLAGSAAYWMYKMISTESPLEEKMALFWHGLFATGYTKLNQARSQLNQVEMFRRNGLGPFDDMLLEISKDPAMLVWLDNQDNHGDAINENYGRELLELFSMGIGNYTEDDIKECARAFTGWTLGNAEYMSVRAYKDSIWPYGRIAWHFDYREEDHDEGREDLPRRDRKLQRRRHYQDYRQAGSYRRLHLHPAVSVLRRRRGIRTGPPLCGGDEGNLLRVGLPH